jgi:hypothetical protein
MILSVKKCKNIWFLFGEGGDFKMFLTIDDSNGPLQ